MTFAGLLEKRRGREALGDCLSGFPEIKLSAADARELHAEAVEHGLGDIVGESYRDLEGVHIAGWTIRLEPEAVTP